MAYQYLTCPETAHLELVECEAHPLGLLIVACSRFRPACAVTCPRTCAARLDRRRHGVRDDITLVIDDPADATDVIVPLTKLRRASGGRR